MPDNSMQFISLHGLIPPAFRCACIPYAKTKLQLAAEAVVAASKIVDEKFAKEEKKTGRQTSTVLLAKILGGDDPFLDLSGFLELEDVDL